VEERVMSDEMLTKEEFTIWQLEELAAADEIDCDEIEILGEDTQGNEGFCTVKIADIAKNALSLMKDTSEKHEADLAAKQVELLREIQDDLVDRITNEGQVRLDTEHKYVSGSEIGDSIIGILIPSRIFNAVIQDKINKLEGK
jgi:hypothetical protein